MHAAVAAAVPNGEVRTGSARPPCDGHCKLIVVWMRMAGGVVTISRATGTGWSNSEVLAPTARALPTLFAGVRQGELRISTTHLHAGLARGCERYRSEEHEELGDSHGDWRGCRVAVTSGLGWSKVACED